MRFVLVLAILVACVGLIQAQREFTSPFELRAPNMRGGVVLGSIKYSYPYKAFILEFTTYGVHEIYQYNNNYGLEDYKGQWRYRSGTNCSCQTTALRHAMPELFVADGDESDYTPTGNSATINGQVCNEYVTKAGVNTLVSRLWWNTDLRRVCRVTFTDNREFTFTAVSVNPVPVETDFQPPSGCKCSRPIDISIVLDRSGTINIAEFQQEKAFVAGFAQAFTFGPLSANLALVHFRKDAWSSLDMTEGTTNANVQAAVDALKCCTTSTNPNAQCCCCGTSISSGTIEGANQLAKGRPGIDKVLIVVTDGYHNHDRNHTNCGQGSKKCRDDLQWSVDYAKRTVPGVSIWAVGVGTNVEVSQLELEMIAGGKERVLRYDDFTQLANNVLDVVAAACIEEELPCGTCCGFCSCGVCRPPDLCESVTPCHDNKIMGVCCRESPKTCSSDEPCTTSYCNPETNECETAPVQCPPNTDCFTYACNPATGLCESTALLKVDCNTAECENDGHCNDNNACTRDICNVTTGRCSWESIEDECDDHNACTVDSCVPSVGCVNTPLPENYCDDQDVCTEDSCDPDVGCVHIPSAVTCADDGNLCTNETCDPFRGCLHLPAIDCTPEKEDGCNIHSCNVSSGLCVVRYEECESITAIAVAAGLGAAAIVGIVIAVAVVLAGVGGGAYAYAKAQAAAPTAAVFNNPTYKAAGTSGTNPLSRV